MYKSDPEESVSTNEVSGAKEIQWTVKVTLIRNSSGRETTYESTTQATFDPSIEQVTFRIPFPKTPQKDQMSGVGTSPTPPPPPRTSMTLSFESATNNE
jgi:hypothetical protein